MRPLRLLSILLFAFAVCLPASGLAAQRVVFLETFTNVSCGPCATQNPITHQFISDYTALRVVNIQYHMSWPSATDPFYLTDVADNNARRTYYGINAVPWLETDGATTSTGSLASLEGAANSRLGTPAPIDLDVAATIASDTVHVAIQVSAVADVPASGLVLRVGVVEPYVQYASPPGNNGEVDFYCAMRDMIPSAAGTPLTISNGQTVNFDLKNYVNPAWRDAYVVVWVQHEPTKEVLQAACSLANMTDYAFFYGWYKPVEVATRGTLCSFPSMISNIGRQPDTYNVHITRNVPASWQASVCVGATCYPPWQTDFAMSLDSGVQDTIRVDIQPLVDAGSGTMTLTATSQNNPAESWSQTFRVISDGIALLVVDDDAGAAYEVNTQQAVAAAGVQYVTWDMDVDGKISAPQLDFFHSVIWGTGLGYPTFDATDRAAIAAYLDGGGNMFVNGQDIGWDIFDPSGFEYSTDAQNWYRNYLGATYVRDDTNDLTIVGVAADPISDGLSFTISGATQTYPSEINPYGGGVACLLYTTNMEAAVHKQGATYKTVYFAFGFEGVTTTTVRNTIMQRILHWFGTDVVAVNEPGVTAPYLASRPVVGPNPFNPLTHVKFMIGGAGKAQAEVSLFDVQGRRVRTLFKGAMNSGPQDVVWDGRSQSGRQMPSGVYLARVAVNGESRSVKMILAK